MGRKQDRVVVVVPCTDDTHTKENWTSDLYYKCVRSSTG